MKVTKDTLQLFCKALGVSASGNKIDLSARVCAELCGKKTPIVSLSKVKTLKGILRSGDKQEVKNILKLVVDLNDEDVDMSSVIKQVKAKFNVKIDKKDMDLFLDVVDASKKKDHALLDEMQDDKKYDFAFKLASSYGISV